MTAALLLALCSLRSDAASAVGCFSVRIVSETGTMRGKSLHLTDCRPEQPVPGSYERLVVPVDATDSFEYSSATWSQAGDDVRIWFTNNMLSGVELVLRPSGSGYRGVIRNLWDFGAPTNVRSVVLDRFVCAPGAGTRGSASSQSGASQTPRAAPR